MTVKKLDIFFFMKSDYNDELIQLNIHIALHLYLQIMSLLEQIRKGIYNLPFKTSIFTLKLSVGKKVHCYVTKESSDS